MPTPENRRKMAALVGLDLTLEVTFGMIARPGPPRGPGGDVKQCRTAPMIPTPPKPRFAPGTRLRVIQHVRVGDREWSTQVEGVVELEGFRPVGGTEMGGKSQYCQQPTLRLRRDDGDITVVALDEGTEIHTLSES